MPTTTSSSSVSFVASPAPRRFALWLLVLSGSTPTSAFRAAAPLQTKTPPTVSTSPRATLLFHRLSPLASTPWSNNNGEDDDDGRPFATRGTSATSGKRVNSAASKTSSPLDNLNLDNFDLSGLTSQLQETFQSLNLGELSESFQKLDFNAIKDNAMAGKLGERGEIYFFAQVFVALCVLGGGLPILGDPLMLLLGPGLLVGGLIVMAVALTGMGKSLSPWPVPPDSAQTDGLVTDGLFQYVRHPSYAGLLAACAGLSLLTGSAQRLVLTALLWYILDVKSDYEESELVNAFPGEYETYQNQVPQKFVPQAFLDLLPWNANN